MTSEEVDRIEMRGWGHTTQSFAVLNGYRTTVVTLDRKTTERLARELTIRAERMVDD